MKKVKIYSIHYNRPEFIRWQLDSFMFNLLDEDIEYTVVNNAREPDLRKQIQEEFSLLNFMYGKTVPIKTIETFSDTPFNLAGKHHADSLNYVWQNEIIKNTEDYSIFIDGDCFLVKDFSVNEFMNRYALAGPKQQRKLTYHYLTPTIVIADINKIPEPETINWEGVLAPPDVSLDTGGGLYFYYEKHPEMKALTKELRSTWHIKSANNNLHCLPDELLSEYNEEFEIEFFGNEFLHYCRSSNWNWKTEEHHRAKSKFVKDFIYGVLKKKKQGHGIEAKEHNFQIPIDEYFGWGKYGD